MAKKSLPDSMMKSKKTLKNRAGNESMSVIYRNISGRNINSIHMNKLFRLNILNVHSAYELNKQISKVLNKENLQ